MKALVLCFLLALFGLTLAKDVVHFQMKSKNGQNMDSHTIREMLSNLKSALDDVLSKDLEFDEGAAGTPLTLHISRELGSRDYDDNPKDQLAELFVSKFGVIQISVLNPDRVQNLHITYIPRTEYYADNRNYSPVKGTYVQKVNQKNRLIRIK